MMRGGTRNDEGGNQPGMMRGGTRNDEGGNQE